MSRPFPLTVSEPTQAIPHARVESHSPELEGISSHTGLGRTDKWNPTPLRQRDRGRRVQGKRSDVIGQHTQPEHSETVSTSDSVRFIVKSAPVEVVEPEPSF